MEKEELKELERKSKLRFLAAVFFIISIAVSGFLIYEIFLLTGIETLIRYIVIGILVLIDLVFFFKSSLGCFQLLIKTEAGDF